MTRMRLLQFTLIVLAGATAIVSTLLWNQRTCDSSISRTVVAGSRIDPMHPFTVVSCQHSPSGIETGTKIAIAPFVFTIVGAVAGRLSIRRRLRNGALTAAICGTFAIVAFAAVSNGASVSLMDLGILSAFIAFAAAAFGALGAWCARAVFA
jgi:hypothetical protein